jgi:hypothetical protein
MKMSCLALSLIVSVGTATLASAVEVPAGELDKAVETLATQLGVDVLYPGHLLDGLTTRGVRGSLGPADAFGKLLEGTSLLSKQHDGAVFIAQSPPSTRPIEPADATPLRGAPAKGTESICHRVVEGNRTQRYCGSTDQWAELEQRVGFRCRGAGEKTELCASASQWKRMDLSRASRGAIDFGRYPGPLPGADPAAERTHPSTTVTPSISAPTISAPTISAPTVPPPTGR